MKTEMRSVTPVKTVSRRVQWGRIAVSMGLDKRLSAADWRVYVALLACERDGLVSVGVRRLAALSATSFQGSAACLKRLAAHGHVLIETAGNGKRSHYRLTSAVFRKGFEPAAAPVLSAPREVERHNCLRCGLWRKVSGQTCYCWSCMRLVSDEVLVRGLKHDRPEITWEQACIELNARTHTKRALRLRTMFA